MRERDRKKATDKIDRIVRGKSWRMKDKCENCPFAEDGEGLRLRKSLRPGRWRGILAGLARGEAFFCHKTTVGYDDEYAPQGQELVCAGSLEWQKKNKVSSQYARVCERLEGSWKKKK